MMNRSWKWTSWIVAASLTAMTGCASLSAPKPRLTAAQAASPMGRQLAMARLAENSEQFDRAKQLYMAVLRVDRGNSEASHRLGVIAARQGQYQQADAHFQRALQSAPKNNEIQNDAGYALYLQGRYEEAEGVLREVVLRDPQNKKAYNNLGLIVGRQGRYQESLELFRQGGSEAAAYNNLAYLSSQAGNYEQAQSLYSRALTLDPGMKPAVEALIQVAQINQREQRIPGQVLPPDGGTMTASANIPQGVVEARQVAEASPAAQAAPADLIEEVRDLPYDETRRLAAAPQEDLESEPVAAAAVAAPAEEDMEGALQAAQQIERPRPSRRRAQQRTVSLPRVPAGMENDESAAPRTAQPTMTLASDEAAGADESAALPVIIQNTEPAPAVAAPPVVVPQEEIEQPATAAVPAETWRAEIVYGRRQSTIEAVEPPASEEDTEPAVASVSDSTPAPAAPLPTPATAPRRLLPPTETPAANPLRSDAPSEDATTQEEHVAKGHYQFAQYEQGEGEEPIVVSPPVRVLGPDFRRQRPVPSAALSARLRNAAGAAEKAAEAEEGAAAVSDADEADTVGHDAEESESGPTLAERVRHWRETRQR